MEIIKQITLPLKAEDIKGLRAGEPVFLSGKVLTARDAAHIRLAHAAEKGEALPIDLTGETIYYLGPAPAKPGKVIGAAGPTSSYRMDRYTPLLLSLGVKGMIGKGGRSKAVLEAMQKENAVYFAAIGGVAALLSKCITSCEVAAYEDLGPEAIYRLTLENFPAIVAADCYGNNQYCIGPAAFRQDSLKLEKEEE